MALISRLVCRSHANAYDQSLLKRLPEGKYYNCDDCRKEGKSIPAYATYSVKKEQ